MPLAAAHRTHIVRVRLIVVVHVAIVEIDVPRVVGVVGVSSTGPVVVGLGSRKMSAYLIAWGYEDLIIRVRTLAFSYHIGETDA